MLVARDLELRHGGARASQVMAPPSQTDLSATPPPCKSPVSLASPPAGYNLQDVNFGRLYKAATQTSKRLLKAVFLLVLERCRVVEAERLPTAIADYCLSILGWSNGKLRQGFNADERALLQQPVADTDFDVTLLTKLIYRLFDDMNLPESFWRAVRDLKNVRNRVCHEHMHLDDKQLTENLNDLKVMYNTLLDETGEIFGVEVESLKRAFCAEIDEILSTALTMEASEYFKKVEQFRVDLVGRFICHGQRELMAYYSKLKVLNPFTWLSSCNFSELEVGRIFTPLLITEHTRSVDVTSLLTTESINTETEEPSGEWPSVLILAGIAGCGKTSLCRYLLHDWRTGEGTVATLRSVDILLHIEARNVTSGSLVTFLQKTLLPDTCRQFEEKDILQALRQMTVLYVIDGMDEATADARQLVSEVFSVAGGARVIVTTRPEFSAGVTQVAERHHLSCMTLSIHGFSDEGMKSFASRVFASLVPVAEQRRRYETEFLKFMRTSCISLREHLKLPLTLALLICLWKNDKTRIAQVTSSTRLYYEIFKLCTSKMASRLQASMTLHYIDIHDFMETWLLALGHEAYQMLEEKEYVINPDRHRQLAAKCAARNIDSIQVFSAFLQCEVKESLMGVEHHFSFSHKSQMEYLAAMYLSHELVSRAQHSKNTSTESILKSFNIFRNSLRRQDASETQDNVLLRSLKAHRWINTLLFIVGHLSMKKAPESVLQEVIEFVNIPSMTYMESTLWRVVEESSRHPLVCEKVGDAMNKNYVWHPDQKALCDSSDPVFLLIQHTPFRPKAIYIRIVGSMHMTLLVGEDGRVEQRRYDNLAPLLRTVSRHGSSRVILRLDQQYYTWGDQEKADDLLELVQPDGIVSAFMGHIGAAGAAVLASVRMIGELCVRVTDPAVLHTLSASLLATKGRVSKFMLRLDVPASVVASDLPRIEHSAEMDIFLNGVDDATATRAAEVLAQLSSEFLEVDLVASRLTPAGAEVLLSMLKAKKVTIRGSLTVRSVHRLEEDAHQRLSHMLDGAFCWWS